VYSLEGGIAAWNGAVAEGFPETRMPYFSGASTPQELISLAWMLEEGSRRFYDGVVPLLDNQESVSLFRSLVTAEEHHKSVLESLYRTVMGRDREEGFPRATLRSEPAEEYMEGGIAVREGLEWARGRSAKDVIELSITLEANAYDLYLKMELTMTDEASQRVFQSLSREEKSHLERLVEIFEKWA
jgi:sulfur-carrier protein adenylyltransferase/sulfurtransferase